LRSTNISRKPKDKETAELTSFLNKVLKEFDAKIRALDARIKELES
tara:strand:+ start:2010 stop:2147 length:138 start_codon:yes stop_codon:yes gene_type:complete